MLVLSIGGNDVALRPTAATVLKTAWLVLCSRQGNIDDHSAWGLGHYIDMFRNQVVMQQQTRENFGHEILVLLCRLNEEEEEEEEEEEKTTEKKKKKDKKDM